MLICTLCLSIPMRIDGRYIYSIYRMKYATQIKIKVI